MVLASCNSLLASVIRSVAEIVLYNWLHYSWGSLDGLRRSTQAGNLHRIKDAKTDEHNSFGDYCICYDCINKNDTFIYLLT